MHPNLPMSFADDCNPIDTKEPNRVTAPMPFFGYPLIDYSVIQTVLLGL